MTTDHSLTLSDFLSARIAEDEAEARQWMKREVRWPAKKILADCGAKYRLILAADDEWVLRILALSYDDHPDYRPEWGLSL